MKFGNTVRFKYILCYHRHWKTLSYLGRPRRHHGGPNGDFMIRKISAHVMNIFITKNFNFGWLLLTNFVTLRTPTTVSVFLNLNICFAEITDPRLTQCEHLTFVNFWGRFLVHRLRMLIGLDLHWCFDCYPSVG